MNSYLQEVEWMVERKTNGYSRKKGDKEKRREGR